MMEKYSFYGTTIEYYPSTGIINVLGIADNKMREQIRKLFESEVKKGQLSKYTKI